MDPYREVIFEETPVSTLSDRLLLPLYFVIGLADDEYLSQLLGRNIHELIRERSIDPIPTSPYVVFASRSLLLNEGWARTFPLSQLYQSEWPSLINIDYQTPTEREPTLFQQVWLIRALRRGSLGGLADTLRERLLKSIYPQKIRKLPSRLTRETLSSLYLKLTPEQRDYSMVIIIDDYPIHLEKTIGDFLKDLALRSCTDADMKAITTTLELLSER